MRTLPKNSRTCVQASVLLRRHHRSTKPIFVLFERFGQARQKEGYKTTPFQQAIDSVHFYPLVAMIELLDEVRESLDSVRRGSEWAVE
jgi:hypothetical protein